MTKPKKRLTKEQKERAIKRANAKFNKLSPAEKRIEICKDVISQLQTKKFIAEQKCYMKLPGLENKIYSLKPGEELELQSFIPQTVCNICAKGAIFLSDILKRDDFKVNRNSSATFFNDTIQARLSNIFSKNQLDLIETAFETSVIQSSNEYLCSDLDMHEEIQYETWEQYFENNKEYLTPIAIKAVNFGGQYDNSTDRLIAIMQNLIANKGCFRLR